MRRMTRSIPASEASVEVCLSCEQTTQTESGDSVSAALTCEGILDIFSMSTAAATTVTAANTVHRLTMLECCVVFF